MVRLIVLGLLSLQAMHGYEIQRVLKENRIDLWANLLPNSIYHALRQMVKEGFIKIQAEEKTGNRNRVIYAITEQGEQEFRKLLEVAIRKPDLHFPAGLYTAFSFSDQLLLETVEIAVLDHIEALEKKILIWQQGESRKIQPSDHPPTLKAIFRNGIEHMQADLKLLRYFKENINEILANKINKKRYITQGVDYNQGEERCR